MRCSRADDSDWHSRLLGQMIYCIEMDLFAGAAFMKMVLPTAVGPGEEVGGAIMRDTTPEQKKLTKSCKHLFVTSTIILLDHIKQLRQRLICALTQPLEEWQGNASKELRSTLVTVEWTQRHISSGFLQCMSNTLAVLQDWSALSRSFLILATPRIGRRRLTEGVGVITNKQTLTTAGTTNIQQ